MKPSWKLRSMGRDAAETVRSSRSLREAARRLGVNVSTVSRAVRAGKLPAPGMAPREAAEALSSAASQGQSFGEWARSTFELTRAEDELVALAEAALAIAHDPQAPPTFRLQAMGRFQSIVKDLALPKEEHGATQDTPTRFPRRA